MVTAFCTGTSSQRTWSSRTRWPAPGQKARLVRTRLLCRPPPTLAPSDRHDPQGRLSRRSLPNLQPPLLAAEVLSSVLGAAKSVTTSSIDLLSTGAKQVTSSSIDVLNKVGDTATDFKGTANDLLTKVGDTATFKAVSDLKGTANEMLTKVGDTATDLKGTANDLLSKVGDTASFRAVSSTFEDTASNFKSKVEGTAELIRRPTTELIRRPTEVLESLASKQRGLSKGNAAEPGASASEVAARGSLSTLSLPAADDGKVAYEKPYEEMPTSSTKDPASSSKAMKKSSSQVSTAFDRFGIKLPSELFGGVASQEDVLDRFRQGIPYAKLLDFGVSQLCVDTVDLHAPDARMDDSITKATGTPAFYAPEMLQGNKAFHGKPADVWASGVTLAFLVSGVMPFWSDNMPDVWRKIQEEPPNLPDHLSPSLRTLLDSMLSKDPTQRPTVAQLRQHPWVTADGQCPMPAQAHLPIQITDDDMKHAIKKMSNTFAILMAAKRLKALPKKNEAARKQAEADAKADASAKKARGTFSFIRSMRESKRPSELGQTESTRGSVTVKGSSPTRNSLKLAARSSLVRSSSVWWKRSSSHAGNTGTASERGDSGSPRPSDRINPISEVDESVRMSSTPSLSADRI